MGQNTAQGLEQGGFPASIGPQKPHKTAAFDLKGKVREKRMLAVEELRHTDSCSTFSARCSSTSEYNDICNAVNRLPDGRRETMRLLIHGHKYNEIAFVMDIPIGTVKSRINCSRIILKEVLKDYMA